MAIVLSQMTKKAEIKVNAVLFSENKNADIGQVIVIIPGHFDYIFFKKKTYKLHFLIVLVSMKLIIC